jgi:hypothetical protein
MVETITICIVAILILVYVLRDVDEHYEDF